MPAQQFPEFCSNPNQSARDPMSFRSIVAVILCRIYQAFAGGSSFLNSENFAVGRFGPITDTTPQVLTGMAATPGTQYFITQISITNGDVDTSTYVVVETTGGVEIDRFYTSFGGGGADPTYPTAFPVPAGEGVQARNLTTGSQVYVSAKGFKEVA